MVAIGLDRQTVADSEWGDVEAGDGNGVMVQSGGEPAPCP